MGMMEIDTPTARITFDEERGYVHLSHLPGSEVTKKDAIELVRVVIEITGGRKYPILVDVSRCKSVNFEARHYFNSPTARASYSAMALVGGTPVGNMLANFGMILFSKGGPPSKMFTSEQDALDWLTRLNVRTARGAVDERGGDTAARS